MLIKNFTDDKFIRAYNSFSNKDSSFYLNDEEFYLYSILFTNQMLDGSIRTNIDIINQIIPIKFIKDTTRNKSKIRDLITSLINKKVLIVETEFAKLKNNTLLELSINNLELSNDGVDDDKKVADPSKFQNFAKIPYAKFLTFTSTKDYYIYYIVSKWSGGFNFSYNSWAEVLGLKHQESAIRVIDDAVNRGIIYKNVGDYHSKNRQNANVYSITPFLEAQKSKQTKKQEAVENYTIEKEINKELKDVTTTETRTHNWDTKNSQLTEMDLYIYMTTNDDKLKSRAKRRIDAISNSGEKGAALIDSLILGAEYIIEQDELKLEKKREQNILHNAKNAVKMKTGEIVPVDKHTVESIDWKKVESVFYKNDDGELVFEKKMVSFQSVPLKGSGYDDRPDMIKSGWELYKDRVKSGIKITTGEIHEMTTQAIMDNLSNDGRTAIDMQIDGMNQMDEINRKRSLERDASEIF